MGSRVEAARYPEEKLVVVETICVEVIKRFFGEKGREQYLAVVLYGNAYLETGAIDADVVPPPSNAVFVEVPVTKRNPFPRRGERRPDGKTRLVMPGVLDNLVSAVQRACDEGNVLVRPEVELDTQTTVREIHVAAKACDPVNDRGDLIHRLAFGICRTRHRHDELNLIPRLKYRRPVLRRSREGRDKQDRAKRNKMTEKCP